jgi:hypothetical protein
MSTLPPRSPSTYPPVAARCPALPADMSWTSLLADTSVGLGGLERRRVRVRQPVSGAPEGLRLVVQSYRERDVIAGRPLSHARPLAAAQRTVSADQLSYGVQLDLMHFEPGDDQEEDVVVIAWAEEGAPDLDYDGLEARPPRSARWAAVEPLRS